MSASFNFPRANIGTYAGLVAGGTMWGASTQLGQILPYLDCAAHSHLSALVAFGGLVLTALGGLWSWRSAQAVAHHDEGVSSTARFIALLSGLAAAVFVFALALQGAAGLVLSGCER
jgi:hypothetical protein